MKPRRHSATTCGRWLPKGPAERLAQTVNTQPVMLTAGIAAWRLWLEMGA